MATHSHLEMSEFMYPGLHAIFLNHLQLQKDTWTAWMNVESSKKYSETDFAATGLGRFMPKPVGKGLTYDSPVKVGSKTYTHVTYALGYRVEEEMVEDDLYSQIKKYPKMLSTSASHTVNIIAHAPLNNAFTDTSAYHGVDGKPLCSTSHPLSYTGGTQANTWTTAQEFSRTSLQAALIAIRQTKTPEGRPAELKPVGVIHDPSITPEVWDVLGNPKIPETDANARNWVNSQNLTSIETDWLLNSKWWFVVCQKAQHTLMFFWRVKITFKNATHFDTGDIRYAGRFRASSGFTWFYGLWGTNPS